MNSVFVIIPDVITHQAPQMLLIQRDHMIEKLPTTTADPAFRRSILPGRSPTRSLWFQTRRLQKGDYAAIEFRISVQDDVAVWARFRKSFAQLLHHPICRRMRGHIEVDDSTARVLDDEQAVQHSERYRWDRKEIEGYDGFAVIVQKSKPFLARITPPVDPAQIPRYGPFGERETEFQQLTVDFRRSPIRILPSQAPDQKADLLGDWRPATAFPGSPAPE